MPRYEYKVVPAPVKGLKAKGLRTAEARFAHAVQELMNGLSGYGWEYLRAETLPSLERAGLTGSTTEWRNVLVFRRVRETDAEAFAPELLAAPDAVEKPPSVAANGGESTPEKKPAAPVAASPQIARADGDGPSGNGGESTENMVPLSASLTFLARARNKDKSEP